MPKRNYKIIVLIVLIIIIFLIYKRKDGFSGLPSFGPISGYPRCVWNNSCGRSRNPDCIPCSPAQQRYCCCGHSGINKKCCGYRRFGRIKRSCVKR